jgi:hypothetical protein
MLRKTLSLFHDTIRRNLLWVNPEADEAAL